ncbi:MAG TPA: hypothetical protein VIX59_17755 [Candidatus Binataceae bacterium]
MVERLERFVSEVDDVPDGQVAMVGRGGEQHVGDLARLAAGAHRRHDAALGAFGVAHLHELAEPSFQGGAVGARLRQGAHLEARWVAVSVVGDRGKSVEQCAGAIFRRERRQQVHHARERGEARAPAVAPIAHAELEADSERLPGVVRAIHQCDNRLADDQRNVALHSVAQPVQPMAMLVVMLRDVDHDFVVLDLDRIYAHVVGPLIEGAAAG